MSTDDHVLLFAIRTDVPKKKTDTFHGVVVRSTSYHRHCINKRTPTEDIIRGSMVVHSIRHLGEDVPFRLNLHIDAKMNNELLLYHPCVIQESSHFELHPRADHRMSLADTRAMEWRLDADTLAFRFFVPIFQ